jgi:hypothetical protein
MEAQMEISIKRPLFVLTAILVALTVLFAGCSNDTATTPGETGELNLTSEFGGYDASDEAVAYGDDVVADLMKGDDPVTDPIMADADVDSLEALDGSQVYILAVRWGMLEFDSTVTQATDWSGTLALKHGFLNVRRLLRFERGQDNIVRPRPDRQTIEWVSQTTVSFDGLVVAVIVPPVPDGEDWSDNELSFTTGPYARTFALYELEELDELIDVDELGNQVAFNAWDVDLEPCGGGHLDGRWLLNPSGKNGNFYGRWMAADGELGGYLRGHFGTRGNGEMVFFGKYIGLDGKFRGLLRGVWGFNLEDDGSGWFRGVWAGRDGRPVGSLNGRWSSSPPPDGEIVDDKPGNGNGYGNGRNPRNDAIFGTDNWTKGYFGGQWVRLCPTDGASGE